MNCKRNLCSLETRYSEDAPSYHHLTGNPGTLSRHRDSRYLCTLYHLCYRKFLVLFKQKLKPLRFGFEGLFAKSGRFSLQKLSTGYSHTIHFFALKLKAFSDLGRCNLELSP